ncbi:MAG: arylsulfatase [Rubripirellula sp.]|nr:arylsulfatase [Rubripirellula sp.]
MMLGFSSRSLVALGCFFLFTLGGVVGATEAADRPNIIYIMADDMGFSDIGCYGSEISTPHLDRLAEQGVRFTQFYNTARCCPTRASLLTGLYPHQAGVGHMMDDRGVDGYRGDLNRQCVTLAEVLKTAGYRTYMSGKWHVTKVINPQSEADKHNWPIQRGFDQFYGTIHGAGSFFDPNTLTRGNQYISPYADPEYTKTEMANGEFYYTDAIADHASRFIHDHHQATNDEPFFLYVAFTAAHWPMHALEKDIAKYQGRYDAGYEAIRKERYQRMITLGLIDESNTELWPMPEDWKETEHWEWDKRNMEVYAAMIDSMDQGIGRIIESLKNTGQFDNTLICYFQDNGGCAEGYGRGGKGGPRSEEPTLKPLGDDYLQPNMTPTQSRDGFAMRTGKGSMAGPADTAIGYGRGWATVSNTPFREYKHWVHEGGISTPLIAHWPAKITRKGELESTPSHLVDLMATAADLAEADYPTTFHGGQSIHPMEGKSLLPAFLGQRIDREAIYWEHEGNRAVRMGDWKLVAKGAKGKWELYNIAKDRSEQRDLSSELPERTKELAGMWQAYAERAHVLPLNPRRPNNKAKN